MTKTRLPPTWLVLVPALALAAVGARAVMAEMRASQDAARDRARSVASRLARSVDALVAEYVDATPTPDAKVLYTDLSANVAHLEHATVATLPTGATVLGFSGWGLLSEAMRGLDPWPKEDRLLVEDALARADALAKEPAGAGAAEALLSGVAAAVRGDGWKARLLLAAARRSAANGDPDAAFRALDACPVDDLFEKDGRPVRLEWMEVACGVVEKDPASRTPRTLLLSYSLLAADCTLGGRLDDPQRAAALDRVEASLGPRLPAWARQIRARGSDVRAAVRALEDGRPPPSVVARGGDPLTLTIWAQSSLVDSGANVRPILIAGDIPAATVRGRVGAEAEALAREPRCVEVRLIGDGGARAFDTRGDGPTDDMVVEAVSLGSPLSSWRAEAVVAPETEIPATAWLLGAAVVATTAALLAGTIALRRAAERSARLAEERRTFLDHVAHELRTPSAAVLALTEELASGHVTPERELVYRTHLLRESRRLAGLVDDTLDFARLDAGRLAFKMEPADLRDVVRQAIEESDGAGRVVATLPDAPVVRDVDAAALRRAVKNLVENAVRHGGGDAPVDVSLETNNGHASIVVADHGRGIAAEHLPRIFERFYRVPSATHETKGVGLGLALCREIARAHGGDVAVASEVGKGSTFTLRVPLK